jgi:hypothetical protein
MWDKVHSFLPDSKSATAAHLFFLRDCFSYGGWAIRVVAGGMMGSETFWVPV